MVKKKNCPNEQIITLKCQCGCCGWASYLVISFLGIKAKRKPIIDIKREGLFNVT